MSILQARGAHRSSYSRQLITPSREYGWEVDKPDKDGFQIERVSHIPRVGKSSNNLNSWRRQL